LCFVQEDQLSINEHVVYGRTKFPIEYTDEPREDWIVAHELKSKSGKVKAKVRFKIIIPSNPNYNPLTERRKSESNISLGAKLAKNIKDGVRNSFNLETVAESFDEPDAEPYSQPTKSSPLVQPRISDTRRHTIADLDKNVSLTDLPMVKRRDSIRRKKNPKPALIVTDYSEGSELEKLTKENQMLIKMNSIQQETIKQKDAEINHLNEYIDSLMVKIITRAPDILQSSTPL